MVEIECPNCHLPLRVEDPTYTRVLCDQCRTILELKQNDDLQLEQPQVAALTGSSKKLLPAKASNRAMAQRPNVGSGPRHANLKSKPKAAAKKNLLATVGIGVALITVVSLAAFAITRSRGTMQASVADPKPDSKTASEEPKKNSADSKQKDTPAATEKAPDALLSPKELEARSSVRVDPPKVEKPPVAEPAKEVPQPPVADPVAERVAEEAKPVEQPVKLDTPPEKNLTDLLNAPTQRGKKSDDDEALVEAETAARAAKAAADKPKPEEKTPEDSRVKFKPDNPFAAKDEAESAKSGNGKMETGAAKKAAIEPTKEKAPALPELPTVCAGCMGTGYVPVMAPRKLVRTLKDPVPPAALLAPWKQCPKCKAGTDDKALADAEAARMKDPQVLVVQQNWAQMVAGKLDCIETRHVSVRSQLPLAQNKIVGDALEQLTEHLQRHTKATILTPTRPDTHELFLFSDRAAFETIRDSVGSNPDFDKAQLAKISGVSMRNKGLYHLQAQQKPENMALFLFGRMTMTEVTDGKGPFWLVEGFAAYCENTVMKKNLCYSITYEVNDVKFSPNWDDDIRKFAAKRQLKPWKDIFPANGMLMKPLEYLTCYSMVAFLIKTDPQRFNKLIIAIREGHPSPLALKIAYGRDVDELQRLWAMWALTAK